MTHTYSINLVDSETPPAWITAHTIVDTGPQDSGRYRITVTTNEPEALEAELEADDSVLEYDAIELRDDKGRARSEIDSAIARSVSHAEIVMLEWSEELESELSERSEDNVDANETYEAWGTDKDGAEWRVHLSRKTVRS